MKTKKKRCAAVARLIELYDSFRMTEFMDQSVDCEDINVRVMRMLCYFWGRYGRNYSPVVACDYSDMTQLEELASRGDCVAQVNLGQCYYQGIVVGKDSSKARDLFERAAKQGYLRGRAVLGSFLTKGELEADCKHGVELLKGAANDGCAPAMCNLGQHLLGLAKTKRQIEKARRWILKGADAGVAEGYAMLCNSFFTDRSEVARIVRRAWEQGSNIDANVPTYMFSWGSPCGRGRLDEFSISRLPIEQLKRTARRDPVAKTFLAYMYLNGKLGLELDYKKSVQLFRQAAKRGVAAAQCLLGECYYRGWGCRKNFDIAFRWFSLAAEQNEFQSLGWLGNMYYKGEGCKRNIKKSADYDIRAAELGNEGAQYNLALRYLKLCDGLPHSPKKAIDLLWPLACHGRPRAIARLGECYLWGTGVPKDEERAYGLLAVAARFTNIGAQWANVKVRQNLGYLKFYEAAHSHVDKNNIDSSILRMLEMYDRDKESQGGNIYEQ
ncbi:MAG: tetratricopeptide repeat protein [bacterium]|nr:tetratricopeptide repeat protein [bacterium]